MSVLVDVKRDCEIWLPVPNWEGYYEVSSTGRVRSLPRKGVSKIGQNYSVRGRVLAQGYVETRAGVVYRTVHLSRLIDFIQHTETIYVHRLVALAFCGEASDEEEVRHRNGRSSDNRAENLEWGTSKDNSRDRLRHGTHPSQWKHCRNGHEYTEETTAFKGGWRQCLTCKDNRMQDGRR